MTEPNLSEWYPHEEEVLPRVLSLPEDPKKIQQLKDTLATFWKERAELMEKAPHQAAETFPPSPLILMIETLLTGQVDFSQLRFADNHDPTALIRQENELIQLVETPDADLFAALTSQGTR